MHWIWQNIRDHLLYGRNNHFFLLSVFLLAAVWRDYLLVQV